MNPTVSVVLNCYNHQLYIGEAIESVLGQTFEHFELIVIDNGSTDGSRRVMETFKDPRIRLIRNDSNESLSKRLNEGVAAASGEFVSILYSDDMFLPDKLERQVSIFRTLPPDYGVVYAPGLRLNQATGDQWQIPCLALSGDMIPAMLDRFHEGSVDMCSPLIRRDCLIRYPFFDDLFADGEMIFFRIAMRWRFHFDPQPVVALRDHEGNRGRAIQRNHVMMMEMWDRVAQHSDFPAQFLPNLRHLQARACINHAWIALRMNSKDDHWLREQVGRGLAAEPSQILRPRGLATVVFSRMPAPARSCVNALINKLRRPRDNRNLLQDYS